MTNLHKLIAGFEPLALIEQRTFLQAIKACEDFADERRDAIREGRYPAPVKRSRPLLSVPQHNV